MRELKPNEQINRLSGAVKDMDCLSRQALSEIVAITDLLLHWMESPECYHHIDKVADALTLISYRAQETIDNVGREAESVGCEYVDHDRERRHAAAHQYKTGRGEHA
ncbi:hypothetical protein [Yersinia pekkanenii]|uniref:Uncharacterized protein n=1 Tax=Yersinia pekkanenii TaxID=1288385 RepID=A0A0T9RRB7_9GAMM|nr:hypothetical protein [Yersinia pekkanenii]CNI78274.1 Uncharacterised protein [Yersinia pekkanenii]CRY69673.1 Uncharacterised protein [Yersinia pekkanenii]